MKPWWSPKSRRAILSQLPQVADSLTLISAADPETGHPLVDSATAPFGLESVISITCQGTQQESDLPMPQVTGPLHLVLAVDLEHPGTQL